MSYWSKKTNEAQTFADLIRGLQHSVNAAMEMIETRNIELLGRYFNDDGTPFKRRLSVDESTQVDIPLISIVNPTSVNIKEVEMDFSVEISTSALKCKNPQKGFLQGNQMTQYNMGLERSSLEIGFGGKKDASRLNVKVKFEAQPIPEGLSRIIDEYDKTIMTFQAAKDDRL